MKKSILAADIGGTNSRFAHFQTDLNSTLELTDTIWIPTTGAQSFADLLDQLEASEFPLPVNNADIAVIAVAGPVEDGAYCAPPYISWDINLSTKGIKQKLQHPCLINDFVAQAYSCRSPIGNSARTILTGKIVKGGTIGVLGAGTALGKAMLIPTSNSDYLALPSEGGHGYFPFLTQREMDFQAFYKEKSKLDHITGNLVVSGRGLRYIHWFLTGEDLEPKEVTARFTQDKKSQTLSWAATFYGRVCRDFALDVLATGGLFIAGGVAARTPELLTHENFHHSFIDSPTMGHVLNNTPVFLIDNQDSGLWGAAFYGQQLLKENNNP